MSISQVSGMSELANRESNQATSPRVLRRQQRTREQIISAATEQFAREGFSTVSVEKILEAADVSRGTFYRLFKDKEEVFAEIMRPLMASYGAELASIDSSDPWEIFDGIIAVYIQIWRDAPTAFSLSQKDSSGFFHLIEESHRPAMTHMHRLFKLLEPHGILRADKAEDAVALMTRSAVVVLRAYDGHPEWERLFSESMRGLLLSKQRAVD